MKTVFAMISWSVCSLAVLAQTTTTPPAPTEEVEKPSVKVSGYVRSETFFDTYKSSETRDGEVYLYPLNEQLDADGNDINKVNQIQLLGLQSRIKIAATGGSFMGAKTSGFIETDFLGNTSDNKYVLRLRHALIKLDWEKSHILAGQYWHMVNMPEISPNTVTFGAGVPFNSLNRAPQIRYTYDILNILKIVGGIHSYALHKPKENSSVNSQRYSGLPDMQFQVQLGNPKTFFASFLAGYKWLKPYLSYTDATGLKHKVTENVGSYNVQTSLGLNLSALSIKAQYNYGENLTFLSMIGGYGQVVSSINGEPEYANMNTLSTWIDLETKGKTIVFGLFAGYSENLGSSKEIQIIPELATGFDSNRKAGGDLRKIMRVAPRIYYIDGPVDVGLEYSVTNATYGTFTGEKIEALTDATLNNHILLSIRYSF